MIEIKSIDRKRPRLKEGDITKRSKPKDLSYVYWLNTVSIGKVKVCKSAFLNVYGITDNRIRRLRKLQAQGKSPIDKRGKCIPGNAKPADLILDIQNHIRSFPVYESHYSSNTYRYLSAQLNILTMWKMYKALHPETGVKYSFYSKIFKQHFSLRFGQPQADTCCTCETLNLKLKSHTLNDVAKRAAAAELLVHRRRANKFFQKIKCVSELLQTSSDSAGLCFDFMQNMQLPQTPIQETFYLRQLSVSLFNIHCLKTNKVKYYLYHEGIAKKSPNEVCSFLLQYISDVIGPNIKHLYLFSDGCGGQNKNHTLVRVLLMLVAQGRFKSISHYFPIRGHSYLPCDRDFSVVKRKLRKVDRVYVPMKLTELVIHSSSKSNFEVQMVESSDILDVKSWWPNYYKKNDLSIESRGRNVSRSEKQSFAISEFMQFYYSDEHVGSVKVQKYIDGFVENTFFLAISKHAPPYPTDKAYTDKIPINKSKIADIKKFKKYLPDEEFVNDFYSELYEWPQKDGS